MKNFLTEKKIQNPLFYDIYSFGIILLELLLGKWKIKLIYGRNFKFDKNHFN